MGFFPSAAHWPIVAQFASLWFNRYRSRIFWCILFVISASSARGSLFWMFGRVFIDSGFSQI